MTPYVFLVVFAERAKNPGDPQHYTSNLLFREDRHRHRRIENDPMDYLSKPLTSSQEVGWHTQQESNDEGKKYYPIRKTEITTNEGRSVEDYFGSF